MKTKKIIALVVLTTMTVSISPTYATVQQDVNNIRSSGNVGTFGDIISTIFNTVGKIQAQYLDLKTTLNNTDSEVPTSKAVIDYVASLTSIWTKNGNKIYYNTDNVGIGVTDPSQKLQVGGNILSSGYVAAGGDIAAAGRMSVGLDPNSGDDVGDRNYNDTRYVNTTDSYDSTPDTIADDGIIQETEIAQNTLDDSEIATGGIGADSLAGNSVGNSEIINTANFSMNSLDLSGELSGTTKVSFDQGANYRIDTNSSGLLFDGGDGGWDFLIYDNASYIGDVIMGYNDTANITSYNANEDIYIDPNGTGEVGIGITSGATQQLDVNGKIRMRTQTAGTDGDDIVATKKYVDDEVASAPGSVTALDDLSDAIRQDQSVYLGLNAGNTTETTDRGNVGIGYYTLNANTSGYYNTGVGHGSMASNTTGGGNTGIGQGALWQNTDGGLNTAVGHAALFLNEGGDRNTAIGRYALRENVSSSDNTAIGYDTLQKNTSGTYNVALGRSTMNQNVSGHNNVAVGATALYDHTSGDNNTAIGTDALRSNVSGSGNVALGRNAGYNETGSNKLYIDNSSTSTPLIGGDFSANRVDINGIVKITGGAPGNGKVLTSDASGGATWQTPAVFTGALVGDDLGNHTATQDINVNGNGIVGLTLAGGGITGNNYNIGGVNQLTINDPGEGINFHGQASITTIDDATDNKININASMVGVGKTPTQKLDVNGNILASGFVAAGGNIAANGQISEGGTFLASKYLGLSGKAADSNRLDNIDSASFLRADVDDNIYEKIIVGSTNNRRAGMYGSYNSTRVGHIWSMGSAYQIPENGSNFGNLYGLAYKHTNNPTGGTMAGGHQMVWTQNGTPYAAMGSNIWTSGAYKVDNTTVIDTNAWIIGDRIQQNSVDSSEIQNESLTAADLAANSVGTSEVSNNSLTADDLAPNSVGNSELIATPTFTNVISNDPTSSNHLATKNYVDTLISGGVSWKDPVPSGSSPTGTYGTCTSTKEGWATYNKTDNIIYMCNGSSWVDVGSTAVVPNATTSSAGKVQISGDLTGTWNNLQLGANSVGNNELIANPSFTNPTASTPTAANHLTTKGYVDGLIGGANIWNLNGTKVYYNTNNVGIGTNDPSQKLEVTGNILSSGFMAAGGDIASAGRISVGLDPNSGDDVGDRNYNDGRYINVGETGDSILDNTIDSSEIQDNTLTTSDILNNTITETDISDSFVARSASKVNPGTAYSWMGNMNTTPRSINSKGLSVGFVSSGTNNAPISYGMLLNVPSYTSGQDGGAGQILFPYDQGYTGNGNPMFRVGDYNNSGWATWKTFLDKAWGDVSYVNVGESGDSILDNTIDSSEIQNETITASDLAPNSVGNSELIDLPTVTQLNIGAGNNNGIRFWSSDQYEISMASASTHSYGPVTSYSIKTNMSNTAGRGFTWGVSGQTPTVGIAATTGNFQTAGSVRAEGGFNVDGTTVIGADAWIEGDRIRQNTIDSSEIQNETITASDLAPNSVGNSELIASPAFTNPTVATPTSGTHVANKAYVDSADTDWIQSGGNVYNLTGNVGIGRVNTGQKFEVFSPVVGNLGGYFKLFNSAGYNDPSSGPYNELAYNGGADSIFSFKNLGDITGGTLFNAGGELDEYGNGIMILQNNGMVSIGGLGINNATQKLDVNGKIRMRIPTSSGDGNDIVATKGYVDSVVGSGGGGASSIDNLSDAIRQDQSVYLGLNAGNTTETTNRGNVGIGYYTLNRNTSGYYNTGVGHGALTENTTGGGNTGIGQSALWQNTDGGLNTAVGHAALFLNEGGDRNTAIGRYALKENISSSDNTAIGYDTLQKNTSGTHNVALGRSTMNQNVSGNNNVAVGATAMYSKTSGDRNVAIGMDSLRDNAGGERNTALGYQAGEHNTGSHNVFIGYKAGQDETGSNKLYIDNSDTSSPLLKGDFSANTLHINGTLTSSSDKRLKDNISTLDNSLNKIVKLRGVSYTWKETGAQDVGLIAQEVEEVYPEIVHTDENTGLKSIEYGNMVGVLIEAMKEQQKIIEKQGKEIKELQDSMISK